MAKPCLAIECTPPNPLAACPVIYATAPLAIYQSCPDGAYCPPGTFPKLFTYDPGVIPGVQTCVTPGQPVVLSIIGCSGRISRTLEADPTQDELNAAAAEMQQEWAEMQALCDALNQPGVKTGFFGNDTLIFNCEGRGVRDPFQAPVVTNTPRGDNQIHIIVINNTDNTIFGNEFTFNNGGGDVHGTVDVPAHTTNTAMSLLPGNANPWELRRLGSLFFSQGGLPPGQNVFYQQDGAAMPPGLLFDSVNHTVYVPSNFFTAATKAEANAKAQAYLDAKVAEYLASGFLVCL